MKKNLDNRIKSLEWFIENYSSKNIIQKKILDLFERVHLEITKLLKRFKQFDQLNNDNKKEIKIEIIKLLYNCEIIRNIIENRDGIYIL